MSATELRSDGMALELLLPLQQAHVAPYRLDKSLAHQVGGRRRGFTLFCVTLCVFACVGACNLHVVTIKWKLLTMGRCDCVTNSLRISILGRPDSFMNEINLN